MTEIYTFLNDLSPPLLNGVFQKQENYYSPRNPSSIVCKQRFTNNYDMYSIYFRVPLIFQDFPPDIQNSEPQI